MSHPIPNDLATLTARPWPLTVGGRTYQVHPLTLADFGALQSWVDSRFPDAVALVNDAVKAGSYTVAQQQFLYKAALEIACRGSRPIGTPEADDLVRSVEGTKQVLRLSISKGDPTFDQAAAEELYRRLTIGDLARVFEASEAEKILSDPKAPSTAGNRKSRRARRRRSTGGRSGTSSVPSSPGPAPKLCPN